MRSATTSMIICEIVKAGNYSSLMSMPLADSGGGGTEVRGAGLCRYYLTHHYRRLKTMKVQRLNHRTFAFSLFFSGSSAKLKATLFPSFPLNLNLNRNRLMFPMYLS